MFPFKNKMFHFSDWFESDPLLWKSSKVKSIIHKLHQRRWYTCYFTCQGGFKAFHSHLPGRQEHRPPSHQLPCCILQVYFKRLSKARQLVSDFSNSCSQAMKLLQTAICMTNCWQLNRPHLQLRHYLASLGNCMNYGQHYSTIVRGINWEKHKQQLSTTWKNLDPTWKQIWNNFETTLGQL